MAGLRIGDVFFDQRNGRYLTLDGKGCDPKVWACVAREYDENADDLLVSGRVLMRESELMKMGKKEVAF
jgi:hypothetical protein